MFNLETYNNQIEALCREYNVESLYVFGSAATNSMHTNSDIDLLVRFKEIELAKYFENYMGLKSQLKSLFNKEVDLIEEQTLKNPILLRSINQSKELLYG